MDKKFTFNFHSVSEYVETPAMVHDPFYGKELFQLKPLDLKAWNETTQAIMNKLSSFFTLEELKLSIQEVYMNPDFETDNWIVSVVNWLIDQTTK